MTHLPMEHMRADDVFLRSALSSDQDEIIRLYHEGLLTGGNASAEPPDDLTDLERTHLVPEHHHFWVAQINGQLVGTIGLIDAGGHVAQIRRLRVAPQWQETDLPCRLVQAAVRYGQTHGYLKVVFDTHAHADRKMRFLRELGFQHARSRVVDGKPLMEFYVNLYRDADPPNAMNEVAEPGEGHA